MGIAASVFLIIVVVAALLWMWMIAGSLKNLKDYLTESPDGRWTFGWLVFMLVIAIGGPILF